MDDFKMMNKKGQTLTSVVMVLLIVIGVFSGYYLFVLEIFENNDLTVDDKYNETYTTLLEEQKDLDDKVNEVKDSIESVTEVESGFLQAINGFKGLGAALLLFIGFIDSSFVTFQAVFFSTDIIVAQVQTLLVIGSIALVLFIIIAILKGESRI